MQIGKMVKVYVWHLVPYTSTEGMRRSWSHVGDNVSSITFVFVIIIFISFTYFVFIMKLSSLGRSPGELTNKNCREVEQFQTEALLI